VSSQPRSSAIRHRRSGDVVTLFLCGDVMLGRGMDQILPHPGDPTLRERHVGDARVYVDLAERANGPIPRPVESAWPWGEALTALDDAEPDVRVLNLETSITRAGRFAAGKAVHYRMAPPNLPALTVSLPDVCVLANNHVLDFGRAGLEETLDVLALAGVRTAGAGHGAR
jgi:poly-gamma-glutamate capsule biosynthesis protein CapA/YwtB (metallophosphatase superfamily)